MLFDWIIELGAVVLTAWGLIMVWQSYPDLPDQVPIHFNLTGRPDQWGSRSLIWLLPVLGVVLYASLSALSWSDLPTEAGRLVAVLKLETAALFLAIEESQVRIAKAGTGRLSRLFWILLALSIGTSLLAPWLLPRTR
jgi:hypothetical protein